jgi:hypothetical protein
MEASTVKGFLALPVKLTAPGACIHLAPGPPGDGAGTEPHHFFFFKVALQESRVRACAPCA